MPTYNAPDIDIVSPLQTAINSAMQMPMTLNQIQQSNLQTKNMPQQIALNNAASRAQTATQLGNMYLRTLHPYGFTPQGLAMEKVYGVPTSQVSSFYGSELARMGGYDLPDSGGNQGGALSQTTAMPPPQGNMQPPDQNGMGTPPPGMTPDQIQRLRQQLRVNPNPPPLDPAQAMVNYQVSKSTGGPQASTNLIPDPNQGTVTIDNPNPTSNVQKNPVVGGTERGGGGTFDAGYGPISSPTTHVTALDQNSIAGGTQVLDRLPSIIAGYASAPTFLGQKVADVTTALNQLTPQGQYERSLWTAADGQKKQLGGELAKAYAITGGKYNVSTLEDTLTPKSGDTRDSYLNSMGEKTDATIDMMARAMTYQKFGIPLGDSIAKGDGNPLAGTNQQKLYETAQKQIKQQLINNYMKKGTEQFLQTGPQADTALINFQKSWPKRWGVMRTVFEDENDYNKYMKTLSKAEQKKQQEQSWYFNKTRNEIQGGQ